MRAARSGYLWKNQIILQTEKIWKSQYFGTLFIIDNVMMSEAMERKYEYNMIMKTHKNQMIFYDLSEKTQKEKKGVV